MSKEYYWECEICKKKLKREEWKWSHEFSIVLCEKCYISKLPELKKKYDLIINERGNSHCGPEIQKSKLDFIIWLRKWIKSLFSQQFSDIRMFFDNIEDNFTIFLFQEIDRQIIREILKEERKTVVSRTKEE